MGGNKALVVTKQVPGQTGQNVEIQDRDIPKPGQQEVLVRVHVRPINPADLFQLQGSYPSFKPKSLPAVAGLEGVGTVEETGPGSSKFSKGQRVVWTFGGNLISGDGSWQTYLSLKEDVLLKVPDKLDDLTASQFYVNPCTAFGLVETLAAAKGEWILQSAAGSVLGRQLIQIAKRRGVKTINLVRRREQIEELTALGADEVLVTEGDYVQQIRDITGGEGAWGAADAVAGAGTEQIVQAVRPGGTVLIYGMIAGAKSTVPVPDVLFQGKVVRGFVLAGWLESLGSRMDATLEEIMDLLAQGVITPLSGKSFPLEQGKEAIAEAERPARGGKAFLVG